MYMQLIPSKYNKDLYHMKIDDCLKYRFVVRCESTSCIFDKQGKKYIELQPTDSMFESTLSRIFEVMNEKFNTDVSPNSTFIAKIPFRYGKYEIKISSDEGYWLTTDDVKINQIMYVDLELSTVYNFGIHWIVKHINIL